MDYNDTIAKDFAVMLNLELDNLKSMLLEKNRMYGDSALHPIRMFSKSTAGEQILVRIDDKLSRVASGVADIEDVILDLTGYLILLMMHKRIHGLNTRLG